MTYSDDTLATGYLDGYDAAEMMLGYAWQPTSDERDRQAASCSWNHYVPQRERATYARGFGLGWDACVANESGMWGEYAISELLDYGKSEAAHPDYLRGPEAVWALGEWEARYGYFESTHYEPEGGFGCGWD